MEWKWIKKKKRKTHRNIGKNLKNNRKINNIYGSYFNLPKKLKYMKGYIGYKKMTIYINIFIFVL